MKEKRFLGSLFLLFLVPVFFAFCSLRSIDSLSNTSLSKEESFKKIVPKVLVIVIIDGCSYETSSFVRPYLRYGLKYIVDNATQFSQAFYANGLPTTAPGHTTFITGVYPHKHGIVGNSWFDGDTKVTAYSSKEHMHATCMVDTLTDQMKLSHNKNDGTVFVYSCSTKKRAARALAGSMGIAIWFDEKTGRCTSTASHDFIDLFNAQKNYIKTAASFEWLSQYPLSSSQYALTSVDDYRYASAPSMINKKYAIDRAIKKPYEDFIKTPLADALVIDMAQACIIDFYQKALPQDRLVLCISLSAHDKLAHVYGQYKYEPIDSIYSADKCLQKIINQLHEKIKKEDIVWVFSADHGGPAIEEDTYNAGLKIAKRFDTNRLVSQVNKDIAGAIGIDGVIRTINTPFVYVDHGIFDELSPEQQKEIFGMVRKSLLASGAVSDVWVTHDIMNGSYAYNDIRSAFAKQIFEGRCGEMVFLVRPYTLITEHPKGTSHEAPYAYDTHVPLMIYWPGQIEKKSITDQCEMVQVAPTLAYIFGVPRPSASTAALLPGIY